MIATAWQRELLDLGRRPRALTLKLAYPLVVGLPLLFSSAPPFYASMALTMLAATLSALGTGAVFARERSSGLQLRFRVLPVPAWRQLLDRLAGAAAIDLLQLLPLLVVLGGLHPSGAGWWPALAATLAGTILLCNAVGALASSFAGSPAEVMLYVLLPLLPAFYLSGLFVPPAGAFMQAVAAVLPFSHLHAALDGALGGAAIEPTSMALLAGLATLVGGGLLASLGARRVLETD